MSDSHVPAESDDPGEPATPAEVTTFWRALRVVVAGLFPGVLGWQIEVVDVEHVPAAGPAVVTWNHHSYVDFLLLGLAIHDGRQRMIRVLGKSEIWDNPVLAWIARQAKAVPVHRGERGGGGALDAAIEALRGGDLVVVAPEQTISESFELLPFAHGAATMALTAGVPVVPSVGWGSHRFATKGHTLNLDQARGLPVTTRFGPPLHAEPDEDVAAFTARIQTATADLLHEVQAAYPDRGEPGTQPWWLPARLGGSAPDHATVLADHTARMQARRRRSRDQATIPDDAAS